jgi:hypothetical protein
LRIAKKAGLFIERMRETFMNKRVLTLRYQGGCEHCRMHLNEIKTMPPNEAQPHKVIGAEGTTTEYRAATFLRAF